MKDNFSLLVISISVFESHAQEKPIETDRPDQSDGASIVEKNKFQFETSFYFNHFKAESPAYVSSSLLRYGIFKNIEFRVLVEQGVNRDVFISETTQGQYPLAISSKISLIKDAARFPDISLVGYLQLPFTNAPEKSQWSPAFFLIVEKEWKFITLTLNGGPKEQAFEHEWVFQASGDVRCKVTPRCNLFGEYFAEYGHDQPMHNVDAGVVYYINPHFSVQLSAGSTIFYTASNFFVNTGFAFQL